MSLRKLSVLLGVLVVVSMILTACPAPQPQVIEKVVTQVVKEEVKVVETQVVEKQVEVEKVVTKEVEKVVEKAAEDYTTPHPILSDIRVRQAIAHCSNRDDLIASVYSYVDDATKPKLRMDSWIPKTSWAHADGLKDYEFSVEKGGALLDEAGWKLPEGGTIRENDKGETLSIKFTTTTAQFRQTWSAVFVQQMAACGIQIIPQYVPASWWFGDTTGLARRDFELGAYAWVGEPDPGGLTTYKCDQINRPGNNWEGQNYMGWCNQTANDAIVKANNTLIKDERVAAYKTHQEEFLKDMVSLPVFQRVEADGWSNNLQGLKPDPTEYGTANVAEWTLKDGGDTVVWGASQEPASMYTLVEDAAVETTASFVGGQIRPYYKWNYDYQPGLLDPLPSIENGLALNNTVDVKPGDMVYDLSGKPVKLEKGTKLLDADGKQVEYDGSSPLQMKQLVVTYKFKDFTWSDGTKGSIDDIALGAKNDCDKDSGATSFIRCEAVADMKFATDKLEATLTHVPGYQNPTFYKLWEWYIYPSHQKLSDGRLLKDVPAKEWATLPEIAEKPLSYGPFQLVDWKKGQSMTFEANKYANPAPKLKKFVVQFFPDTQTAVAALLGGDVDWLDDSTLGAGAEVQTVVDAAKEGKVQVAVGASPTWEHIDMNLFTK